MACSNGGTCLYGTELSGAQHCTLPRGCGSLKGEGVTFLGSKVVRCVPAAQCSLVLCFCGSPSNTAYQSSTWHNMDLLGAFTPFWHTHFGGYAQHSFWTGRCGLCLASRVGRVNGLPGHTSGVFLFLPALYRGFSLPPSSALHFSPAFHQVLLAPPPLSALHQGSWEQG